MAWTTALGNQLDVVWSALLAGESGLRPVPSLSRLRNLNAAIVPDIPLDWSAEKRLRTLASDTIRAALASAQCRANDPGTVYVLGTSLGAHLDNSNEQTRPLHEWADEVVAGLGSCDAPIVISTACSAGSDAIALGDMLLRSGLATRCVCGGFDVLTESKRMGHSALSTMSPDGLFPFDERHSGTLLGEGAAVLVLETGPDEGPWRAWLRGTGSANDAAGLTAPEALAAGPILALQRSLAHAGLDPGQVGLINAHGSGTPINDAAECRAFSEVFSTSDPLVFATKGAFGHTLGATGAIEAVATILALRSGQIPPTLGLRTLMEGFPLCVSTATVDSTTAKVGLSLTLGFGGFDTSLVFSVEHA